MRLSAYVKAMDSLDVELSSSLAQIIAGQILGLINNVQPLLAFMFIFIAILWFVFVIEFTVVLVIWKMWFEIS